VRKILFIFSLWLGVVAFALGADSFSLTDGGAMSGDIVKFDDNGVMIHLAEDVYTTTNVPWARFSQDTLKQLAANPKIRGYVEPFIEPTEAQRPQKAEIQVNQVTRLELPANPSLFSGLFKSSLGLVILLLIYAANLFAAYEISIVKARMPAQVMGVAAVLPIIGPVIFLILPMYVEPPPPEEIPAEAPAAGGAQPKTQEQINIAEASWKPQEEKKPEAQVYARGKFTFNKRFVETRFAAFIGATEGDLAKKFSMEVRSMKEQFAVERIAQVGATDVIFETPKGQITVPFTDIQEIKLNPKTH
jgi:hypothetical protein